MNPPDPASEEISVHEAAALAKQGGWRIIDCREPDEADIVRLAGSELMPLSAFHNFFPTAFDGTDERPILALCHHGMRSLNLTRFLRSRGTPSVWSVRGGIDAWATEIDPSLPRY